MEENSPYRSLSRRQEKNLLKAAELTARTEFQCPDRIGCPDSRTLSLVARRDSSLEPSPDLIDHIATCSPCFIEYSRIRAAHKLRVRVSYGLISVAVVVVLLVFGRSLYVPFGQPAISQKETARSLEPLKELVVDLRMWGTFRSDAPETQRSRGPLRFPRGRLSLSIFLPVGSEEGTYDVALVDSSERSLREAEGQARLRNFVQVLPVELNLSDVSPGLYELRIRRAQMPWNAYPVLLE
jgi:hypothetical protein